jgi:predicted pyridoxine 5'-phosphate oxidase superfamily flavin-nucleotide-binding protein
MITKEMKNLIEKNAMALATLSNKKPYVIAVGFAKVVGPNKICITNNYMQETPLNLKKNQNVALAVWSRNWEKQCKGFEFRGIAKHIIAGKWRDFVQKMPENKGYPAKAAIIRIVEKIKRLA